MGDSSDRAAVVAAVAAGISAVAALEVTRLAYRSLRAGSMAFVLAGAYVKSDTLLVRFYSDGQGAAFHVSSRLLVDSASGPTCIWASPQVTSLRSGEILPPDTEEFAGGKRSIDLAGTGLRPLVGEFGCEGLERNGKPVSAHFETRWTDALGHRWLHRESVDRRHGSAGMPVRLRGRRSDLA